MWKKNPTDNSYRAFRLLEKYGVKNVLVPGFGYGRNAKVFYNNESNVTRI